MFIWVIFCEIITPIGFSWYPKNSENVFSHLVPYPIKSMSVALYFLLGAHVYDSLGFVIVCLYCCGCFGVSHLLQGKSKDSPKFFFRGPF